jgi:hypothetical protein
VNANPRIQYRTDQTCPRNSSETWSHHWLRKERAFLEYIMKIVVSLQVIQCVTCFVSEDIQGFNRTVYQSIAVPQNTATVKHRNVILVD